MGQQVTCPKCSAAITVPASQQELAVANPSTMPAELEQLGIGGLVDFDELPELIAGQPKFRTASAPSVVSVPISAMPKGVSISRTAVYLQAVLLLLIAAVAFGLGYWLGGVDAQRNGEGPPAVEATPAL
jgi:hypothetical protein